MNVSSQQILRQIVQPGGTAGAAASAAGAASRPFTIAQILHPSGPGLLVAEPVTPAPEADAPLPDPS